MLSSFFFFDVRFYLLTELVDHVGVVVLVVGDGGFQCSFESSVLFALAGLLLVVVHLMMLVLMIVLRREVLVVMLELLEVHPVDGQLLWRLPAAVVVLR